LILLPGALAAQTHAAIESNSDRAITLDQIGAGELLWKSDKGWIPLPVADVEVELSITGMMSRGRLTQRFANPTESVIEAVFVFPLPDRAAVHHMEMRIGDRRIVSTIREKEEARKTYEQAKQSGRKASLLDQQRPNLFKTSVANINPGEKIEIFLEYYEEVDYVDGRFSLRFPLTFTPRFTPPAMTTDREDGAGDQGPVAGRPVEQGVGVVPVARVEVFLRSGVRLESVTSESHPIEFAQAGDALRIDTRPRDVVCDRDFVLEWRPEAGAAPRSAVFVEERDGERYLLLMVLPPSPDSDLGLGLPTETLFIVDVSGSMNGPSISQAKAALIGALERLRPEDRFNVLVFNDGNRLFRPEFQHAEGEALDAARQWVASLNAGGGTMIYPALMRGLTLMGDSRSSHAQRIVFLTDGAVANEQQVLRALSEHLGDVRLHTVGIGNAPNAYLMRKMARFGHGLCAFISNPTRADNQIAGFLERLDRPVMEGVELNLREAGLDDVFPQSVPDLHAGEPLLLSARLSANGPSSPLTLGGYTRDGWLSSEVKLDAPVEQDSGVALRWARARIGGLMDSLIEGADAAAVRADVVELALDFHLVTRYTSLVAVEERPSALGASRAVRTAAALPIGGTDNPLKLLIGTVLSAVGLLLLAVLRLRGPR
jgi:Ca-activated chloride channel family protein